MQGSIKVTTSRDLKVHTFTAPERGWQVNSHIIELPSQLLVIDAQYLLPYAREVVAYTAQLQKPIARLYISHYHPDHLLGASAFSAPLYALAEVSAKIAAVGERVAREEHEKFGDEVPTGVETPTNIVKAGVEKIGTIVPGFHPHPTCRDTRCAYGGASRTWNFDHPGSCLQPSPRNGW